MSTVAWDGKTLAADRQATTDGTARACSKIRRAQNSDIMATTGGFSQASLMMQWYEDGADLASYPEFQKDKDDWCRLIVARQDSAIVVVYERYPVALTFAQGNDAWGSGQDYALGALAMGASADRAVEIASQFDISTGMGVDFFTLEPINFTAKASSL